MDTSVVFTGWRHYQVCYHVASIDPKPSHIISPKFFQKLIYVTTLSELAQYVPLTQIDVPPAVYR